MLLANTKNRKKNNNDPMQKQYNNVVRTIKMINKTDLMPKNMTMSSELTQNRLTNNAQTMPKKDSDVIITDVKQAV